MKTGEFKIKNECSYIWYGAKYRKLADKLDPVSLLVEHDKTAEDILYVSHGKSWMTWGNAAPYFLKYDEFDRPADIVIVGKDFLLISDDHCCHHWVYIDLIEPKNDQMKDFFKDNYDK